MRQCDKCLNNAWSFEFIDGYVRATCKICSEEVEFEARNKPKVDTHCRKCDTELVVKQTKKKPSQLKKVYYYTAYNYCPKCRTIYYTDKYKVFN